MLAEQEAVWAELRSKINQHYSLEELRTLCFDLEIDFDQLAGENKQVKVRELILYCNRHNLLKKLIDQLQLQRGHVQWPEVSPFLKPELKQDKSNFFADLLRIDSSVKDRQNQLLLLEKVNSFWIDGVLEQSLHNQVLIELGKETDSTAVDYPWEMIVELPSTTNKAIPRGTRIIDIFTGMKDSMLILGEPGSGKTVTLLELARDAIDKAKLDPSQSIPVVFNLSSWAEKQNPIEDWLVAKLNSKYQIPKRIARPWVENDNLLLLLDGLDEVAVKYREDCVEAINIFRLKFGLTSIAVCSRIEDYYALGKKLKLQGAILLQPLKEHQVKKYFEAAGSKLSNVKLALEHDDVLRELTETPLTLSILSLAYQNISLAELQDRQIDTLEKRRYHLFDTYINRMLMRRKGHNSFSPEQLKGKLSWLANNMVRHKQSVFMLEEIQPSWLSSQKEYITYAFFTRIMTGVLIGLVLLLFALPPDNWWLLRHLQDKEQMPFIIGSIVLTWASVVFALASMAGIRFMRQGHTITGHSRDTVPILAGRIIFSYVVLTFTFFTVFRLTWPIPDALDSGILRYAAFFCILPSILIGLRGRWQNLFADIRIVENFSWSWRNFLIFFIPVGLILSSIIFVATTVSYSPGIRVWDVENEEFVASFDTAQFFAYKNQLFVYDNESPVIEAWNPKEQIFSLANGVSNIILQSDEGNPLFITFDETSTRFWSIENGLEIAASMSGSYVDSWPSQSLVVTGIDGIETLWDITDGVLLVGNIKNDWRNEDFLIVTNDAGRSRVFRKDNGQEIVISEDIDTGIVRAAEKFSFVLTENEGGTTQFLNSVDGTLLGKIQNNWQDDGFFNVVDKDGNVRIFYYYGRGFDLSENIDGMFTWISNNNSLVITKNENELSQLWHNKDGAFLGIIQNDWQIDGSLVITKNENGLSQLWHDEDGVFLGSIQNDWQTDDFFVIEKEDGRTSVLDRSNNQTIVLSENIEGKIVWATINGSLVITEDANRTPQLWQSRDGILLGNIQNDWQTDDFFVIEKEDGRISVLDRFNDQTIVLSENIEGNIVWVTINGSLVITEDANGTPQLWQSKDGVLLGNIQNDWQIEDFVIVLWEERYSRVFNKYDSQEIILPNSFEETIVGILELTRVIGYRYFLTENERGEDQLWFSEDGVLEDADLLGHIQGQIEDFFIILGKDGHSYAIAKRYYYPPQKIILSENIEGKIIWITENDSLLVTEDENGNHQLWRNENGTFLGDIQNDWQVERYFVVTDKDNRQRVFSQRNGLEGYYSNSLGASFEGGTDDRTLVVVTDFIEQPFQPQLWRSADGSFIGNIQNDWQDDSNFVVIDENGVSRVFNSSNGQEIILSDNIQGRIAKVTADWSYIITENDEDVAQLWRSQDGVLVGDVQNDWQSNNYFVIKSEDDRFFIYGHSGRVWTNNSLEIIPNSEGLAEIWRINDGVMLGTMRSGWWNRNYFVVENKDSSWSILNHVGDIEFLIPSNTTKEILRKNYFQPQFNNFSSLSSLQPLDEENKFFIFKFEQHTNDYRYISLFPLLLGLILGFIAGLQSNIQESKTRANQGTFLSLRNSLITGLSLAIATGLIIGGVTALLGYSTFALNSEFSITLSSLSILRLSLGVGLLVALWLGLVDILQHLILRLILIFKNRIFFNYVRFLDQATEKILLRKVGGGYIFVHRLLMEHFAYLEKTNF